MVMNKKYRNVNLFEIKVWWRTDDWATMKLVCAYNHSLNFKKNF